MTESASTFQLTVYPHTFAKEHSDATTLAEWAEAMRDGKFAAVTDKVQGLVDQKDAYTKAKQRKLPAITYGGNFCHGRKLSNEYEATPFVFMEWDQHGEERSIEALRTAAEKFMAHPAVTLVYRSVGGNGLHVVAEVTPIPTNNAEYKEAWLAASASIGLGNGDPSVKNANRISYASYDPRAYFTTNVVPVEWKTETSELIQMNLVGATSVR